MEKFKCRMLLAHKGVTAHYNVDLLLEPGQAPLAVLEWGDFQDGTSIPSVGLSLDPQYLHPLKGWGAVTHMYEMQMDSPIPLAPPPSTDGN